MRVGKIDDCALDGVALVAVDEHVWPSHHLHREAKMVKHFKMLIEYTNTNEELRVFVLTNTDNGRLVKKKKITIITRIYSFTFSIM